MTSDIAQKINNSSLGTRQARAARASIPINRARAVMAQANVRQGQPKSVGGKR